ncbi:hypothetical protein HDV00_010088 [Rhizophlyctis rosea]|nr:hypothetical protein HDV00_010088 [Rhizophlyctis rosea]
MPPSIDTDFPIFSDEKGYTIHDIRSTATNSLSDPTLLRRTILSGLAQPYNEKTLTSLVLYDDNGLKLFEEITYQPEYYLTNKEIEVLKRNAEDMAACLKDGSVVVDALRKTSILLSALEQSGKRVSYYALDLDLSELHRTLSSIAGQYNNVSLNGLHGTYDDGREWLRTLDPAVPTAVLWLGSSVGNLTREEAADFLNGFQEVLSSDDVFMIGIDNRNDPTRIRAAYNDSKGVTAQFALNGLNHVNKVLGEQFWNVENFVYNPFYNEAAGRNEAYVRSLKDQILHVPKSASDLNTPNKIHIRKGELIRFAFSYKYDIYDTELLFSRAEAQVLKTWSSEDDSGKYFFHALSGRGVRGG